MKEKLIIVVERSDGTILKQWIKTLTTEETLDNNLVQRAIHSYMKLLGKGYYLIDYYFGY